MIDMAEIGLELNRIRQISDEIKGLDQTLTAGHFGELYDVLERIQLIVNEDDNIYGTVGRISRNANAIADKIKGSLNALEMFIDQQVSEYEKTDEVAYERLSAVLERMSKLLGINFSKMNIDSTSTAVTPSVTTTTSTGTSSGTYVTTGASYSGAATPFVAAAGAGVMAMGGAKAAYSTPMYNQSQIATLRAQAEAKAAYNAENTVTGPTSRWYGVTAGTGESFEPTVEGIRFHSFVHGPNGEYVATYINENLSFIDENGNKNYIVLDKNGNIMKDYIYDLKTGQPEYIKNANLEFLQERNVDRNNYNAVEYYEKNGVLGHVQDGKIVGGPSNNPTPAEQVPADSQTSVPPTSVTPGTVGIGATGYRLTMDDIVAGKVEVRNGTIYDGLGNAVGRIDSKGSVWDTASNGRIGIYSHGIIRDRTGKLLGRADVNGNIIPTGQTGAGTVGNPNPSRVFETTEVDAGLGATPPTPNEPAGAPASGNPNPSRVFETTEVDANIGGKPSTQEPINTQTPSNTEIPVTPAAPTSTGGSAGRNNTPTGLDRLFDDDVSIRGNKFYDEGNKLLGTVNPNGIIVDSNGQAIGKATPGGTIIGVDGKQYGSIAPAKNGSTTGYPTKIPGFEGKNTSVFTDPGKSTVDPKPVASVPSATPTPAATRPRIIDPKNTSIPRVDHPPITKGADRYSDINKMFAK